MSTRRIYCERCGQRWDLLAMDREMGINSRKVRLALGPAPAGHGFKVIEVESGKETFEPMINIKCDSCGAVVKQGEPAYAVSTWHADREGPPDAWEHNYGVEAP